MWIKKGWYTGHHQSSQDLSLSNILSSVTTNLPSPVTLESLLAQFEVGGSLGRSPKRTGDDTDGGGTGSYGSDESTSDLV